MSNSDWDAPALDMREVARGDLVKSADGTLGATGQALAAALPAQSGSGGASAVTATFTGSPRGLTGVLADDDAWHNTTGGLVIVVLDGAAVVARDAAAYTAVFNDGGRTDGWWPATGSAFNVSLALIPPTFYLVVENRTSDTYTGFVL